MRVISTLVILWSICNLARSRDIPRDGEDGSELENILEEIEDDDKPSFGRSLTQGRAAAVDHQNEAAGSRPPPLPFFHKPGNVGPPIDHDDFVEDLASLIKRRIWKHVQS